MTRLPISCHLLRAGKLLPVEEFLPQRVLLNLFTFNIFLDLSQQFGKSFYPGECDYSLACNLLQVLSLICARLAALFALKTAEKRTRGFVSSMLQLLGQGPALKP